ncbi:hypothetical protein PVT67_13225 [Gallaecimonas kandeliae]|uniref:hypothetical protein n=1 Tax=Gallaecimonas kandeliae TaxID=3029055 RepID=UPI002647F088|nr:hypothetical protein [Gallaecimonas kandeliae]WKE64624.1 hypothetical protein PVT67_13225 [Gallaecimonas kandeliae]
MPAIKTPVAPNGLQNRQQLQKDFAENQVNIYAFNARELTALWAGIQRAKGKSQEQIEAAFQSLTAMDMTKFSLGVARDYGSSIADSKVLAALAMDMRRGGSILGKYYFKTTNGQTYVVFKGYAGLRKILTSTRYLASNSKVVQLGITGQTLRSSVKGGVLITVVFSIAFNTIDWIFKENYHWSNWLGTLATDVTKAAIASTAGYFAGVGAAAVSTVLAGATVAVAPLIAGIVIGIAVGYLLNQLDANFKITQSLINALDRAQAQISQKVGDTKRGLLDGVYYIVSEAGQVLVRSAQQWTNEQIRGLLRRIEGYPILR